MCLVIRRLIRVGVVSLVLLLGVGAGMQGWEYRQTRSIRQALYDTKRAGDRR